MRTKLSYLCIGSLLLAILSGCVASTSGHLSIMREQVIKGRYYVERSPKDGRDLATTIAERMRFRGLDAVAGPAAPSDVDYIVTYIDRWHWDMRMYMSDMRIELHTAKDRSLVGYGDSAQSSLAAMGKSYADVIDKALGQLLMPR